ncbi:MAG: hypothetical protein KDA83_03745 [Planctomycetales bacterium]|nr:hypothetical protein [Planctomycetales bacterium]
MVDRQEATSTRPSRRGHELVRRRGERERAARRIVSRFTFKQPTTATLLGYGIFERVQYPSLLLVVIAFWFVLAGFFGSTTVGIPYLFWHAQAEIAVCAGLAIGVFLGEWCFVNFLLDSDRPWLQRWVACRNEQHVLMRYLFFMNLIFAGAFLPTPFFYRVSGELSQFNLVRALMSAVAIVTGVSVYVCAVSSISSWVRSDHWLSRRIRVATGNLLIALHDGGGLSRTFGALTRWLLFRGHDPQRFLVDTSPAENEETYEVADAAAPRDLANDMVWVHVVSGIFFWIWNLLLIAGAIVYARTDNYSPWLDAIMSPAVLICMLLILGVRIYGFMVFHLHRLYFALVAGAIVTIMGLGYYDWFGHKYPLPDMPFRHAFPDVAEVMDAQRERLDRLDAGLDVDTDRLALERWLEETEATGGSPILVVVATSGGGIRAQIWTTAVLGAMERMVPELPYRTRLVTGASGGMVGAAYYVATIDQPRSRSSHPRTHSNHAQAGTPLPVERLVEISSQDSLTPTARTLFFRDLPRQIMPFVGGRDRGEMLERTWIANSGGEQSVLHRPLRDLEAGELSGWCPSLVFTPALLEDGRRLFLSNLNLAPLTVARIPRDLKEGETPVMGASIEYEEALAEAENSLDGLTTLSAIESRLIEDRLNYRFDIATAARLNASFPLISPPIAMPVDRVQWSLGDAAYYDNYGMNVAVRWLERHHSVLQEWRDEGRLHGILLLQIVSSEDPRNSPPTDVPRWTDGWMTPLRGLLVHGFQKIVHTSDQQLATLARTFPDDPSEGVPFLRHETIAFRGDASLSWYLTPEEVYALVYPFERTSTGGQLDFDRFGTPAFQRELGRASRPTQSMEEFRHDIQVQMGALQRWWIARRSLGQSDDWQGPHLSEEEPAETWR